MPRCPCCRKEIAAAKISLISPFPCPHCKVKLKATNPEVIEKNKNIAILIIALIICLISIICTIFYNSLIGGLIILLSLPFTHAAKPKGWENLYLQEDVDYQGEAQEQQTEITESKNI